MPASFSVEYEGRTVEVIPDPIWEQDRVRLVVDGETVAETKANAKQTVLAGDGFEVRAVMPFWGGSVKRASLVPDGGDEEYELDPEPGTRAARVAAWGRRHPKLYASRYVLSGAAQVAAAIIGFTFLLRLSPRSRGRRSTCPTCPGSTCRTCRCRRFRSIWSCPGGCRRCWTPSRTGCRSWSGSCWPRASSSAGRSCAATARLPRVLEIDTPHGPAHAHPHLVDGASTVLVLGHGAGGGVGAPDLEAATQTATRRACRCT